MIRMALVALAAACALALPPAAWIERTYSNGLYRWIQPALTSVSNRFPFALIDIVILGVALWVLISLVRVIQQPRRHALPFIGHAVVLTAVLTIWLFVIWGFNIRRLPLRETVAFDASAVTQANLLVLAERAVTELNVLAPRLPTVWPSHRDMDRTMEPAFAHAAHALGVPWHSLPARPKSSLLSPYLRAVGLNGMNVPFFGEVYLNGALLDFERPYVVVHEWAHVAGRRSEHEAAFIGWLACMFGPEWAQYSAWMRLYEYVLADLPMAERAALRTRLNAQTRRHFAQRFARVERGRVRTVQAMQSSTTAALNTALRVDKSALDYGLVVQLVLGVRVAEYQPIAVGDR
jgi:hypothetical protein